MSISDDLLKHKILIQRLTSQQAKHMLKAIKEAKRVVTTEIKKEAPNYRVLHKRVLNKLTEGLKPSEAALLKFGKYESEFIKKLLVKWGFPETAVVVDESILNKDISTGLVTNNKTIRDTYKLFAKKKSLDIINSVKDVEKEERLLSLNNITRGLIRTQLFSLSTTVINKMSAEVHKEAFQEAKIEQVMWESTLDDAVCDHCEDLHGQIFEIGDAPECPAHANCRCELVPYVE